MMVACNAWGQSQPPAPTPAKSSDIPLQQSDNSRNFTSPICNAGNPPPTVAVACAPVTNLPSANKSQEQNNEASPDWWIRSFTGLLVVVGFLQWRIYRRQTSLVEAQNRASVFLKTLRLEVSSWENEKPISWKVIATFENSGTTPPRNLRYNIFGVIVPADSIRTLRFEPMHEIAKSGFVGPRASIDIHAADVREVPARNKSLVWGWIEYGDVFSPSDRHRTEFCFEFGCGALVDLDNGSTTLLPEFVMHERHNGMDEDCVHKPRPYRPD